MNFRSNQQYGTTFVYTMPFSETKALIEYTLFSEKLLEPFQYEAGLKEYIAETLGVDSYKITETEFGIIPMTNHRFLLNEGNIIHIGTAGGQTKASSGFTFGVIQKQSASIVQKLVSGKQPICHNIKNRFRFYDSTLLYILQNKKLAGEKGLSALFK